VAMPKIKEKNPVVELDGDEMTRIMWSFIKNKLILKYRGTFDNTLDVVKFGEALEQVCVETVESGDMTRDLAILIRADHPWLTTNQFLDKLDSNLQKAMV
jgi:isocitrate dehydrogenase